MVQILHICDAFTNQPFSGNPAAVCLLDKPADEQWMRLVAREMNLSETAFIHRLDNGFSLRWLTPLAEVKLCGHATLASASVLWQTGVVHRDHPIVFQTLSGQLTCRLDGEWIAMDFPAKDCVACEAPAGLTEALGCEVNFCGNNGMDYLVEIAEESALRELSPNMSLLSLLPVRGVIVTSKSDHQDYDFVSRFFAPAVGVAEDPVTGSAHCALGPYWRNKLNKSKLTAFQASPRGGVVQIEVLDERVILRGQAVLVSRVELFYGPTK